MQVHLYVDDLKDRKIKPEKAVLADFWLPIPVLSFDDCVVFHYHCADHRIGRCLSPRFQRELDC